MNTTPSIIVALLVLACVAPAFGQSGAAAPGEEYGRAVLDVRRQLDESIAELNALREAMAAETVPLSRTLRDLETELDTVRREYQETIRRSDDGILRLNTVQREITQREETVSYLTGLFGDYIRKFESTLHIAEVQRYRTTLEAARRAAENATLTEEEFFRAQSSVVEVSLERIDEALGGTTFSGTAVNEETLVRDGTFVLIGPTAIFRSADGRDVGLAEQRLGSLEPAAIAFGAPADAAAADELVASAKGSLPLDPTLGTAHQFEAIEETVWEHVQKGGPVMWPIFVLAALALLVALIKWVGLLFVRRPSKRRVRALLEAVAKRDKTEALQRARAVRGPAGRMLVAGVTHLEEPRELIEEIMYEQVLTTRLKLNRMLPFIAICAAAAPLLGLLGTVTGIISTFELITVFGSGDVKTLSGGISQALITTECGLIVAIPALLIHALLSRKARGAVDQMEKAAIALINQIAKTPFRVEPAPVAAPIATVAPVVASNGGAPSSEDVRDILADLLVPVVKKNLQDRLAPTPSTEARPVETEVSGAPS